MSGLTKHWSLGAVLTGLGVALLVPGGSVAATLHPTLLAKVGYGATPPGFARSADGTLHVAFETNINWGDSANGVGALSISPSGHVGPQVQALNWNTTGGSPNGIPGLAVMPSGALEATFGGSPGGNDGPWGISSSDGGSTWSAPVDIGSGSMGFGDSAVGVQVSNGTPVLTAGCCGGIVIQQGFGPGAPTYLLTNNADNAAGNTDSAVDAATGADVASWDSNAGSGGIWFQQVAPTEGAAVKVPVPSQYGTGEPLILAGRDVGPGVYGAYPANYAATTPVRLIRYGGGSVAVGSVHGLHANVWGVATGPDGRLWAFWWGQVNGKEITAVTRSNKAVTRFEPIQKYNFTWGSLFTMSGDGRLGPLDLLMSGTPATPANAPGGIYYARIQPTLSASVKVKKHGHHKFALKIRVTDAGDAVAGAAVAAKGKHGKTSALGTAKLTVHGSSHGHVTVTISDPGYRALKKKVKL
jgi:hypothetical protein